MPLKLNSPIAQFKRYRTQQEAEYEITTTALTNCITVQYTPDGVFLVMMQVTRKQQKGNQ